MKKVLFGSLPGRAIVAGLAIRLADLLLGLALGRVPVFVAAADTVASVVIAAATIYLLARGLAVMQRRLLWRVRRRLIVSYIFIGFVPAMLLLAFVALGGILLFYDVGAYLVREEFRALSAGVRAVALTAASDAAGGGDLAEVLQRHEASAAAELPGLRLSAVAVDPSCAGPAVPAWVGCGGFSGLLKDPLVVRAVAFPGDRRSAYGVVAELPVGGIDGSLRRRFREATGVELGTEPPTADSPLLTSIAYLEYADRQTGSAATLPLPIRLSLGGIYGRISAPGIDGTRNVVILLLELVGGLFLAIEIVALVAGFTLARSITGSVDALFAGTERVTGGDLAHRIAVEADDQLGDLQRSFNAMTDSIAHLLKQSAEKKRLEEELRIAHDIQMSLLPQGPLRMPGASLSATCVPASEVGGDYYDFLRLDDHRFGLLIADVAGKGTFAALYMAELKGIVLALSRLCASPRELLVRANRLMAEHLDARSFITMAYAVVDLQAGTLTYARAGHTPLMHLPGPGGIGDGLVQILTPDGLVLGLKLDGGEMFERLLEEHTVQLRAGDLFLFFTDGLSEAMDAGDDPYGEARLAGVIERHAHLPCQALQERVFEEIATFVGAAPQHDDMTMILLKIDNLAGMSRCA